MCQVSSYFQRDFFFKPLTALVARLGMYDTENVWNVCETEPPLNVASCFHEHTGWWYRVREEVLFHHTFQLFVPCCSQTEGNELKSLLTSQCKTLCFNPPTRTPTHTSRSIYSTYDPPPHSFLIKTRKDKWGECGIFFVLRSGGLQTKRFTSKSSSYAMSVH